MSYILDALKRAESERERGVVPGLHSHSVPLHRPVAGSRAVASPLILAGAVLGLAMLGVLAWRSLGPVATGGSAPDVAASPPIAGQVMAVAPAMPVTSSAVTAAAPTPAAPARGLPADQANKPTVLAAESKPERRPEPRPKSVATVVPAPVPAGPRIVPVGELPADVQRSLPKVVISGSTYSDSPAYRMLIINGGVFREGEKPAPDLQLEQIRPKAAVLNFKGLRYSVAY